MTSLTISGQTGGTYHGGFPLPPVSPAGPSWGTFTNASKVYGIGGPGVVISTGAVSYFGDGPQNQVLYGTTENPGTLYSVAATAPQAALLGGIVPGGSPWSDVTQIDMAFQLAANADTLLFNVVYGSNEYPDFIGFAFFDAFGLFVNGVNIAFVGGFPVDVNHPGFANIAGTQLNGVLAPSGVPLLQFSKKLTAGAAGTLTFILGDASDSEYDTTAYFSGLGSNAPPASPAPFTSSAAHRFRCLQTEFKPSRVTQVDWSSLQGILDAVKPETLPETKWKGRKG